MTLATILSDSGQSQEGLRLMERAMGVAPQDTLIRNNMAAFLIRQGLCVFFTINNVVQCTIVQREMFAGENIHKSMKLS